MDYKKLEGNALWVARPSQLLNFYWFISCIFILPLPIAICKYVILRCQSYQLTNQTFTLRQGVFSHQGDPLELYRIKDYRIRESFFYRIIGLADLILYTSDISSPIIIIKGIEGTENAEKLKDLIRFHVERLRQLKGVREIDGI